MRGGLGGMRDVALVAVEHFLQIIALKGSDHTFFPSTKGFNRRFASIDSISY